MLAAPSGGALPWCFRPWGLFCLLGGKCVGFLLSLGLCEFWFLLGQDGVRQPLVGGRHRSDTPRGRRRKPSSARQVHEYTALATFPAP